MAGNINHMKFSIITCTYNSAVWVKKNIESVKKQVYVDWEHIFIDAFSGDGTVEIIKEYQKEFPNKIKLFQFAPRGISNAMNEGIKKSSGDYLIHLHADDSFFADNVVSDVNNFLCQGDWDWIYGKINVVDERGGGAVGIFPTKKMWQNDYRNWLGRYILKFYNYIPHQAVFIRKTVFDKYGGFDEGLSSAMDPDLWLRLKNVTKWSFFDKIISNFCLHDSSQTASLAMIRENRDNFFTIQRRYLNRPELFFARFINFLVSIKRKK